MTTGAANHRWIVAPVSCLLLWISCSGVGPFDGTRAGTLPDRISLSPTEFVLGAIGGQRRLALMDDDGDPIAPGNGVSWRSSDLAVANVDADGTVTAVGDGTTVITAQLQSMTSTAQVTVAASLQLAVQASSDQSDPDASDNRVVTTITIQAR